LIVFPQGVDYLLLGFAGFGHEVFLLAIGLDVFFEIGFQLLGGGIRDGFGEAVAHDGEEALADAPVILVEALTPSFAEKGLVVDIGVDDCLFLFVSEGASEEFFLLLEEGGDYFGGDFDHFRSG
jgi:hypothetical protein